MKVLKLFLIFKAEELFEWLKEAALPLFSFGTLFFCMLFGCLYLPYPKLGDRIGYGMICGLAVVSAFYIGWGIFVFIKFIIGKIKDNWKAAKQAIAFEAEVKESVCSNCRKPLTFRRKGKYVYGVCIPCKHGHEMYERLL